MPYLCNFLVNSKLQLDWPRSHYFVKIAIADLLNLKIGMRSEGDLNLPTAADRLHAVFPKVIIKRRRQCKISIWLTERLRRYKSVRIWPTERHLKKPRG